MPKGNPTRREIRSHSCERETKEVSPEVEKHVETSSPEKKVNEIALLPQGKLILALPQWETKKQDEEIIPRKEPLQEIEKSQTKTEIKTETELSAGNTKIEKKRYPYRKSPTKRDLP